MVLGGRKDAERLREIEEIVGAGDEDKLHLLIATDILVDWLVSFGRRLGLREMEFVGWMCPCHRRVVRPDENGNKPAFHLISKDEGTVQCNINPLLWQETFVKPLDT